MAGFFTRQRFGRPQFLAGALLLLFLAQAIWLVHSELRMSESSSLSASEQVRIAAGWRQIHGGPIAGAPFPDALLPLPQAHFLWRFLATIPASIPNTPRSSRS